MYLLSGGVLMLPHVPPGTSRHSFALKSNAANDSVVSIGKNLIFISTASPELMAKDRSYVLG